MAFADQGDLENALGGAHILRQLADPNKTGVADESLIIDYLEGGAADVRSAAEVKHEPETLAALDSPSLKKLKDVNSAISARIAYEKGGQGMAMPKWVEERADKADAYLNLLAEGKRRLGRVAGGASAAINQPAGVVDFDSDGTGISIRGFRGGFR